MSCYDIAKDNWENDYPKLIEVRSYAGACALQAKVYVFCGMNQDTYLNSIEVISETSLFPRSADGWLLIEVLQNNLSPRLCTAVAPLNDTDIAILGG